LNKSNTQGERQKACLIITGVYMHNVVVVVVVGLLQFQ
jgi:hypothetical protein